MVLPCFDELWNGGILKLPSRSWALQFVDHPINNNNRIICILQSAITENDTVYCKKKIVVSKTFLKFYVLGYLVEEMVETELANISCLKDLEECLEKLDTLAICNGGTNISHANSQFKNAFYERDNRFLTWRHKQCNYVLNATSKKNMCNFCLKSKKAIWLFIRKQQNSISILARKRKHSDKKRKQMQRLKIKNKAIIKELKTARQKMQNIDKEDLLKKIEELSNLESSQRSCLKNALMHVGIKTNLLGDIRRGGC